MSTASNEPDRPPPDTSAETEVVTAKIRSGDVERLNIAAARRGIARDELVSQAIDAFLAREMWSGGFIAPPPPMEVPGRYPWRPSAFSLRHRK